jgi:hypothetical protein
VLTLRTVDLDWQHLVYGSLKVRWLRRRIQIRAKCLFLRLYLFQLRRAATGSRVQLHDSAFHSLQTSRPWACFRPKAQSFAIAVFAGANSDRATVLQTDELSEHAPAMRKEMICRDPSLRIFWRASPHLQHSPSL